jgi:hypothetical protein
VKALPQSAPLQDLSAGLSNGGAGEVSREVEDPFGSFSPASPDELDVTERVAPHSIHDVIAEPHR